MSVRVLVPVSVIVAVEQEAVDAEDDHRIWRLCSRGVEMETERESETVVAGESG